MSNAKISAIAGIAFVASGIGAFNDLSIGMTMALTSLALIGLMTLDL